jgi:hypothetical protein
MVGPSPVTSNGTESTEFEEEAGDEGMEGPHVSVKENESPVSSTRGRSVLANSSPA